MSLAREAIRLSDDREDVVEKEEVGERVDEALDESELEEPVRFQLVGVAELNRPLKEPLDSRVYFRSFG